MNECVKGIWGQSGKKKKKKINKRIPLCVKRVLLYTYIYITKCIYVYKKIEKTKGGVKSFIDGNKSLYLNRHSYYSPPGFMQRELNIQLALPNPHSPSLSL